MTTKLIIARFALLAATIGVVACTSTLEVAAKTRPAGTRFDETGKVTLHRGQPCTSQIMYDFRPADSKAVIWLAAGFHESRSLTDAAKHHRTVHIAGLWKRGQEKGCSYVDVKNVTVEGKTWRDAFGLH